MNKLLAAGIATAAVASAMLARRTSRSLRDHVALITGGSRGLGLQLARDLGACGCHVVICARDSAELGRALADLRSRGVEATAFQCDVQDEGAVRSMISSVEVTVGSVDILINNAGVIEVGPVASMERPDFENAMNTMFWGTVHCTFAVLNSMRTRRSGTIVNITSIGGVAAVPHLTPYSAAKFAVVGLSEGLGAELEKDRVTVLTVVPGLMRTGSHLKARFKGNAAAEYGWFGLAATAPVLAMAAQTASRKIVNAIRCGRRYLILGMLAYVLAKLHGMSPEIMNSVFGAVNRLLPEGESRRSLAGEVAREMLDSKVHNTLTRSGAVAARDLNEASRLA